ncbi:MAG: alpha/beta hydrolase family protein [Candidatus Helarchaeota archaeon]
MSWSKKKIILISLPFLLLIVSSAVNLGFFFYSTSGTELVRFPSTLDISNSTQPPVVMTNGHLFYPKLYNPLQKYPVVIIVHGFQVDSSTDLRMVLELTKRGFFALSIDLPGAGHTEGKFQAFFWKVAVGAIDYIYQRPDLFDFNGVGMLGHSMGGWTTMLASSWEAAHLGRLNCSVSWAGIANASAFWQQPQIQGQFIDEILNLKIDLALFNNPTLVSQHNPVDYFTGIQDGGQPRNLLIVHGIHDSIVDYEQATMAETTTTNSTLLPVNDDHWLVQDINVILSSIQWFCRYLKQQELSTSEIAAQGLTFLPFYILIMIQFLFIILSTFSLIFLFFYKKTPKIRTTPPDLKAEKKQTIEKLAIFSGAFVGTMVLMYFMANIFHNSLFALVTGSGILGATVFAYYLMTKRENINKKSVKEKLTAHLSDSTSIHVFHVALFGIICYFVISFGFKTVLYYPLSISYFVLALPFAFLISFSMELFLRKGIQDNLPIKGRWKFRSIMSLVIFVIFVAILVAFWMVYLSALAMLLALFVTSLTSTYIYQKTRNILTTTIFQSVITAFFLGNCYFFFLI